MAGIKGQAAVTDALFFLIIVMALVSFLFFFTSQYGRSVGEYATSKYGSDYATSALKTILYSSFPRDGLELEDSHEVDFIIVGIKEDYASDQNINYFRKHLTSSISKVMDPVKNSFDYFFFIRVSEGEGRIFSYPYFFLSRREFSYEKDGPFVSEVESTDLNYYCNATNSLNQTKIDNFMVFVGSKGQAVSSLTFPLVDSARPDDGIVQIVLWNPKDFNSENSFFKELDCALITGETE